MFHDNEVPFYEPSEEDNKRRLALVGVLIAVVVGLLVSFAACSGLTKPAVFEVSTSSSSEVGKDSDASDCSTDQATSIYIHVLGEVVSPGVYELPEGSRAVDCIEAAGGFTDDADQSSLNLASVVSDGQQIRVLSITEAVSGSIEATGEASTSQTSGKVNINTATLEELETLDGIGPSTAQKIIDYRTQNGYFSAIDDITNVAGIGEKKFAAIKDDIVV